MKKIKIILTVLCLLTISLVKTQTLTLDSIINKIERSNPDLQMYDFQISALNNYAAGAKSWDAPQIGTGPYMTPYNLDKNIGSWMFTVQQMIPNPSKLKANQKYMQGMSSVNNENKNFLLNQLKTEARMAYYDWIILKKKKNILQNNEHLISFIINISEARYQYNKEKINNLYKAKASLAEINNMQLMNDNEIRQKMISLNTLMNRNKNIVFDVDSGFVINNYENEIIDSSAIGKKRSDLKAIDQSIKLAQLKQQLEQSKKKPDFGIRYDHMSAFGSQPNQFTLMGMITIPIAPWSSKMYKANAEGLNLEIQSMQKQKESAVNEASGALAILQSKLKSKKQQVNLYLNNIIPALQKNYQTTLLAYEQNTEELFVVLDAWQALNMAQLEYLNQQQELLQLQVDYEKEIEKQ